ncbi:beta-1 [Phytophthora nicotianae]|uniref:Hexosyltransferase n=1 Tax=Phytophthora nicotianae TaxID=4792 RepID=A0A0W8CPZ9_PHYNI|nr:beta-1 [Phytophthora nicotianae]
MDSISDNLERQQILEAVELERDIYGDLLTDELECDDEYSLLAGKVSAFLEWVIAELPRTEFVMITDDDDFVRVDKLVEDLEVLPREGFYIGDLPDTLHSAPLWPIRDPANAYYISRDNYPLEQLFPYAGGPHYLLSMDCVRFMERTVNVLQALVGTIQAWPCGF